MDRRETSTEQILNNYEASVARVNQNAASSLHQTVNGVGIQVAEQTAYTIPSNSNNRSAEVLEPCLILLFNIGKMIKRADRTRKEQSTPSLSTTLHSARLQNRDDALAKSSTAVTVLANALNSRRNKSKICEF